MKFLVRTFSSPLSTTSVDGGRLRAKLTASTGILLLSVAGVGQTWGATLQVCKSGCTYTTIQPAVTAAVGGDTIQIGRGTYTLTGTLFIDKDLTITGNSTITTVIKPATGTDISAVGSGWWEVASGKTLNLKKLTLNGSGAFLRTALHVAGKANLDSVRVTNICTSYDLGGGNTLYLGYGILQDYQTSANMELSVINSTFDNFCGTAIQTDAGNANVGEDDPPTTLPTYSSTVRVENNNILCQGESSFPENLRMQVGVTATGGADVTVVGNTISGCRGFVDCTLSPTYCGYSSAIFAQSTWAAGTRLYASNNFLTANDTNLNLDLFDYYRGPWVFTKNYLEAFDPDYGVYYLSDEVNDPATPVEGVYNWWGGDFNPIAEGSAVKDGPDPMTIEPWITNYYDDPTKVGQPGFWPIIGPPLNVCESGPLVIEDTSFPANAYNYGSNVSIETFGDVVLEAGANMIFRAPEHSFGPGFQVKAGARLEVKVVIGACAI